jgi:glycerophosphoryl diester phosphodiesterase
LNLAKGHVQVCIEIKPSKRNGTFGRYPNIADKVVEEVRSAGMLDQVLVISFDWTILPLIKSLEPVLQTGALVSDDVWDPRAERALQTLIDRAKMLGCRWISMDYELFADDMPEAVHKHGFKLGLWTVNTEEGLRRFAAAGVDSLTSDRPDLFAVL